VIVTNSTWIFTLGSIDKETKELQKKIQAEKKKAALTVDVQKFIDDLIC
jgi:hypothetical protein